VIPDQHLRDIKQGCAGAARWSIPLSLAAENLVDHNTQQLPLQPLIPNTFPGAHFLKFSSHGI